MIICHKHTCGFILQFLDNISHVYMQFLATLYPYMRLFCHEYIETQFVWPTKVHVFTTLRRKKAKGSTSSVAQYCFLSSWWDWVTQTVRNFDLPPPHPASDMKCLENYRLQKVFRAFFPDNFLILKICWPPHQLTFESLPTKSSL